MGSGFASYAGFGRPPVAINEFQKKLQFIMKLDQGNNNMCMRFIPVRTIKSTKSGILFISKNKPSKCRSELTFSAATVAAAVYG